MKAIRQRLRVTDDGRLDVRDPALAAGTEVEVVVLIPEPAGDGAVPAAAPPYRLTDMIGAARTGRTVAEVDAELDALRNEWAHRER